MNVNLTPSVDNSKVTNVAKSASTTDLASSDSGETKGFLDKLASLLVGKKGEVKGEVKQAETEKLAETDGEEKVVDSESLKASSTDALLTQEGEGADSESVAVKPEAQQSKVAKAPEGESPEIPEDLKAFIASDSEVDEQAELKAKTAQAMGEGDKILERLHEANQTLVKQDGKPLPHQNQHSVVDELSSSEPEMQKVTPVPQNLESVPLNSQQLMAEKQASDSEKTMVGEELLIDQGNQPLQQWANIKDSKVAESSLPTQELPKDHLQKQIKDAKDVEALSDSQIAAMLSQQAKVTPSQSVDSPQDEQVSPAVAAAAIPWASSATEAGSVSPEMAEADSKSGPKLKVAQHGAVSQPVHQALNNQALTTQADKAMAAQSAMPAAVSSEAAAQALQSTNMHANPMLSSAMLNQTDPSLNQAALKAGLGAKALAGLAEGKQKGQTSDSHLAQQLSAAAGQQGVNGPQAMRADNLQTQQTAPPLQLVRSDMAADELAERVQVMLSKNLKNIDIRLDPPELGRMHIRMNMNSDGATVHFTVANQQARDALEQSMPRLREMLNNQGVQLGDTSVQQQSSGQQQRYASGGEGSGGQSASGDPLNSDENLDTNVKLDLNVAAKRDGISYYA